ncbi:hypothetical protein [Shewanella sp. KX20019]|uniref:hypothetical protein n=1 Tax=Shewanella sp. KX20019 TaxID=2803864 RepID=UPI001F217CBE|nr:hypothetical protein [Shewanella sp. KX20019]
MLILQGINQMMALFLILSKPMCRMLKQPIERMTDVDGNNPGVNPLVLTPIV